MRCKTIVLAIIAGVGFGSVLSAAPAGAQAKTYTVTTRYGGTGTCGAERSVSVPVGVPTPIDAGGTTAPDLVVQLAAAPPPAGDGTVTLSVNRVNGLAKLAAAVTAEGITFGYDACAATTAPETFRAAALESSGRTKLDLQITNPGNTLRVHGKALVKTSSKAISTVFTPVPTTASVAITKTAAGISGTLSTNVATRLDMSYNDGSLVAGVVLDRFPGTATIEATPSLLRYTGSATMAGALVNVRRGAESLNVTLAGVPRRVEVAKTTANHAMLRTDAPIGDVQATFVNGTTAALPAITGDHLAVRKESTRVSARLRLRSVASADVDWADPLLVDLTHTAAPFTVNAIVDGTTITGLINNLPARATVRYSQTGRSVSYTGSAVINELRATISRATPLFARVKYVDVLVRQLPTSVLLSLAPSGTSVVLDANGATIGSIEAMFTSGPVERLPAGSDGVLFRDLTDRYVIFARVTGLQRLSYSDTKTVTGSSSTPIGTITTSDHVRQAKLRTAGRRPLRVDVLKAASTEPDGSESTLMTMTALPTDVTATATRKLVRVNNGPDQDVGVIRLNYAAPTTTGALALNTDAGSREYLRVDLAPVPRTLDVCTHGAGNSCAPVISPADKGSASIVSSDLTRLVVMDCAKLTSGVCKDFTSVDLTLKKFVTVVDEQDYGFKMFLDTDANPIHGGIRKLVGGTWEYDFRFPNVSSGKLWAQDRMSTVSCGIKCFGSNTGTMGCPSGTEFIINTHSVHGIANFAEEICPG